MANALTADALLTAKEVMQRLQCSRSFVQDHKSELGARRVGRLLRFRLEDVQRFVDAGRCEDQQPEPAAPMPPRPVSLDATRASLIRLHGPKNPVTGLPWGVYAK